MTRLPLLPFATVLLLAVSACKDDVASQLAEVEKTKEDRQARVEQIEDAEVKAVFNTMVRFLAFLERSNIEAAAKAPPEQTNYTVPALKRLQDYSSPNEMAEVFIGSITAERIFASTVQPEHPFDFPLPHKLSWTSLTLENDQVVPVIETYDPDSTEPQAFIQGSRVSIAYPKSDDGTAPETVPFPVSVTGSFTAELPGALLSTTFDKADVGQTQDIGAYAVKLLLVDRHRVAIELRTADGKRPDTDTDAIYIEAQDDTGGFLDDSSSSWGSPDDLKKMIVGFDTLLDRAVEGTLKDVDEDTVAEMATELAGLEGQASLYGAVSFRGTVETVRVSILTPEGGETFARDLTLPNMEIESSIRGDVPTPFPVTGNVYDHAFEAQLRSLPIEVPTDEIATSVTTRLSEFYDQVSFDYPSVLSSIFIDGFSRFEDDNEDMIDLTFHDASGNLVQPKSEDAFEFTINRIEYDPSLFSAPPLRVKGYIPIRRLIDMPRQTYAAEDLPEGIRIEGNMVIVNRDLFNDQKNRVRLFALGQGGRPLTAMRSQTLFGSDDVSRVVRYFYGEVTGIEVFERGESEVVLYSFDVSLERPEE